MSKNKEIIQNDDAVQAVLICDNFNDDFAPLTNDLPLALIPVVNRPLIDYTLDFLALGGVEETFLFCCYHADVVKEFIRNGIQDGVLWSQTMDVHVIVSEGCSSFGDCLRDLDAKGLIRGNFVLTEPGIISNIKLLPIIKAHNEIANLDKGAAMTIIYQEVGLHQNGRCPSEEVLLATNANKRILFHKNLGISNEKKIEFPIEIFLENPKVSLQHNLQDTHISICSPSVLPLFSDNFDYQTRNDFIRGLLMIDEVLDSTIYSYQITGFEHTCAITNWRMYQAASQEIMNRYLFPLIQTYKRSRIVGKNVITGESCQLSSNMTALKSIIGDNVSIGNKVTIENSHIFSNVKIEDDCIIKDSLIGFKTLVKKGSIITNGSIVGEEVVVEGKSVIDGELIQSTKPAECGKGDKLGPKSYRLNILTDVDEENIKAVMLKTSRLNIIEEPDESGDDYYDMSESDDDMSYVNSPVPDDTNMFFTEVIDSLARGIEDKLQCDNLILEINSSRYAYNVTLKEVHFNVVKAILNLPFHQSTGQPYLQALSRCLSYFSPILKNYIRNEDAMSDCLQAIEDVATSNNELDECLSQILNWFYGKDHISEEAILKWYSKIDKTMRLYSKVLPFIKWLQEAEEASSSEEE